MKKLYDLELNEDMQPFDMLNEVQSKLDELTPNGPQEEYLIQLARNFKPGEQVDRAAEGRADIFKVGSLPQQMLNIERVQSTTLNVL